MENADAQKRALPKDLLDAIDREIADKQEPPKALLDAIDEEMAGAAFSTPPGAKPIDAPVTKRREQPMREMITRIARKPRTLVLLVLLLAVVVELAVVIFTERASEQLPDVRTVSVRAHARPSPSDADQNASEASVDANATTTEAPAQPAKPLKKAIKGLPAAAE